MPPRPRRSPAQEAVARINARVGRIGVAPRRMPTGAGFEAGGYGAARHITSEREKAPKSTLDRIRDGEPIFTGTSGRGRLERTLRSAVADIEEGRASGSISDKDADRMLRKAADISEGLLDVPDDELPEWVNADKAVRAIIADDGKKSALDRVMGAGGNLFTGALREVSRPGTAVLSSLAGRFQAGGDHPLQLGPVKLNRAYLGPVNDAMAMLGDRDAMQVTAAGAIAGKEGAKLKTQVTPTTLFESSGINPAARKLGVPVGVVDNPLTHLATYAVTDPLTYVSFGTGSSVRSALRAADRAVPGAAATLRKGGLEALSAADRAAVARAVGPRGMNYLKGAQGGIKVRVPFTSLAEGETAIAGSSIRKPFAAAARSAPGRAVAESAAGRATRAAGRGLERAFVPRGGLRRALGSGIEERFDDLRVAMSHGAPQQTQREIDKVIHVARSTPDLTWDEITEVGRALDIGGDLDALAPRLRPLADAFDQWRNSFTEMQEVAGVLRGADEIQAGRQLAVDAAQGRLDKLNRRLAGVEDKIATKTAEAEAVIPNLEPAARRATEAGYSGGRADAVIDALPAARRTAEQAQDRVDEIAEQTERAAEARRPLATPVDAPVTTVERREVRELVNDLASRADDELGGGRHVLNQGISLPPLPEPTVRKGIGFGADRLEYPPEWDWVEQLDPRTRAAYQRLSNEWRAAHGKGVVGSPDDWPDLVGADSMAAAVDEVLHRVRETTSLEQLARGSQPWWPSELPLGLDPVEQAIVERLPLEEVAGFASNIGASRVAKTSLGQTLDRIDKLFRTKAGRTGVANQIRTMGWTRFTGTMSPEEFDLLDQLRQADVDNLVRPDLQTAPLVNTGDIGRRAPGRKTWKASVLDEVVRARREGEITNLERELADEGLDLPANVAEYVEPDLERIGREEGRAAGRQAEAELVAARAERAVPVADSKAAAASQRAEAAANRATLAAESAQSQAARAAEQSLERGKKVAQATRAETIKRAKLKREIAVAERDLARAEDAFARGVVETEDYFPRILPPDAVKVMKALEEGRIGVPPVLGARQAVAGDKFVLGRVEAWAGKSIHEINEEMRPLMEEARDLGVIDGNNLDWFDPNPFTAFAQRDVTARRHVLGKQFYENLTQLTDGEGGRVAQRLDELGMVTGVGVDPNVARPVEEALAWADSLPHGAAGARDRIARALTGTDEWTFIDVPPLGVGEPRRTFLVRKEIAGELAQVGRVFSQPGKVGRFLDDWMKLWKGYATVPLPFGLGFHLRNAQGNVFLNWLAGLTDMRYYTRSFALQRKVSKGIKSFGDPFALLDDAEGELVRQALDTGVIGDGFFTIDVGRTGQLGVADTRGREAITGGGVRWGAANPFSTENWLIKTGRSFGSGVENNARMAHFMWRMAELGDPAEAARSMRRSLFDYSDVTPFEQHALKRVIPFYTFMRKSAPTVVEGFATTPSKLSRIQQVRMSLAEGAPDSEGLYPEYLEEQAAVPLPMGVSRALAKIPGLGFDPDEQVVLAPDLPVLSTAERVTDAAALANVLPGPNLTDRTPSEGAQGLFGLVAGGAPGAASTAAQLALGRRFFGGSELWDKNIEASLPARYLLPLARDRMLDGRMQPTMTAKADFALENLFPLAAKVPWGTKAESEKAPRRTLSMLTGLRLYPVGDQTQDQEAYRRQDELIRFIESLYAQGRLTKGADDDAAEAAIREDIEARVRERHGIEPSRRLPAELKDELDRLVEEAVG